ncbi:MAG: bifunctional 4-hydroxy-2-oxoglutarate aldolase/2-dehydro-3-deoxy-phosphogluconate aldolase [Beutenbergiaceae bacterium]
MSTDDFFDQAFHRSPVMVILRGFAPDEAVRLAHRAWSSGIGVVEVPLQRPGDDDALAQIVAQTPPGCHTGAGTVTSPELADRAAAAGASFTVAPGWDEQLYRYCAAHGVPQLPGVATPSEVQAAGRAGASWLKAFPATVLGVDWFAAIRAPFPQVRLVATGGIGAGNAADYLAAGARVVSLGSSFAAIPAAQLAQITSIAMRG